MDSMKKMMGVSAALLFSAVSLQQTVLAIGPEVELHLTSLHFDNQSDFNTENFGIGINYPIKQSKHYSFSAGTFDNSYDEQSFYLGVTAQYDLCKSEIWVCSVGVIGGVITGYEDDVEDANAVQPVALPQFKLGYNGFTATTRFIPDLGENSENVLTLSVGKEF